MRLIHVLLVLMLVSVSFAADWTLSPDGKYVWFENENALINCTTTSNELVSQSQVCDFTYKGASPITLNTSLVFNLEDGVKPEGAAIWQNISHVVYVPAQIPVNHTDTFGSVSSITSTSDGCEWGAGATKRKATFQNGSRVYCFDGWRNDSGTYTVWSVWNETTSVPTTEYWNDWNDITGQFGVSQFGAYKVGTIQANWNPGQTRRVKFNYDTKPNTNGKFDIYFHTGSAEYAKNNPEAIKLILDPWWNSSWGKRENITLSATVPANHRLPIILNSTVINYSLIQSAGQDLRFTDENDVAINHCIMAFNNTGNSYITVKITNASITKLYVYFNNSAASDGQNCTGTYDNFAQFGGAALPSGWTWNSQGSSTNLSDSHVLSQGNWGQYNKNSNNNTMTIDAVFSRNSTSTDRAITFGFHSGTHNYADTQINCHFLIWDATVMGANMSSMRNSTGGLANISFSRQNELVFASTSINSSHCFGVFRNSTFVNNSALLTYPSGTLATIKFATQTYPTMRIYKYGERDFYATEPTYTFGAEESSSTSTNISDCTNLDQAGHEYNLTADITDAGGSCMNVSANNIILDLKGFTIDGTNVSGSHGINASAVSNFTVKNGKIQEFEYNIIFRDSLNMNVLNMTTEHGRQSEAAFTNTNYTNVSNCTFLNSYYTAIETTGFNLSLSDSVITGGGRGVVMNGGGGNHTINRVNISGIDYKGFDLWGNATTGFISNIIVHDTGETCIDLDNVSGFNLANITIYDCGNEYAQIDTPYMSYWSNVFIGNTSTLGANWSAFNISAKNITEGTNIHIHEDFVSLDSSALTELDEGATITITTDASCVNDSYFKKTGFPTTKADILTGTRQGLASCAGGVATFTVSSFSGYAMGDPLTFTASFKATSNETDNNTMSISAAHVSDPITAYSLLVVYNNTDVLDSSETGISNASLSFSQPIIAPLVAVNETDIEYFVYLNLTYGTTDREESASGNQSVWTYYFPGAYSSSAWASVWEASRNLTITLPSKPALSPVLATHTFGGANDLCTEIYANGTLANTSSCNSTITDHNSGILELGASHYLKDGVIALDYWPDITYNLSFDETPESTSAKQVSLTRANSSREGFYWLVNFSNGSIQGAPNISRIIFTKFYDSDSLLNLSIDSASMTYTLHFPDGESKSFFIGYAGAGAVNNATTKAYPNTTAFNISSIEAYAKTGYRTTARFMNFANTSTAANQNVSVYLIAENVSTYAIISVVDNGEAVQGAYVSILKYYSGTSEYIQVDERTTNSDGKAATYIDPSSFYKFAVYSSEGELLYYSTSPEQFICETTSLCEITINIGVQVPITIISPYASGSCYGNNATNAITFLYGDATGQTSSINFLAYRENVSAPVCNYTISAATGSYVCTLPEGENLSQYMYSCEVWRTASPPFLFYVGLIDFRLFDAIVDWMIVAMAFLVVLGTAAFHVSIAIGLGGIGLFILSVLGVIQIPTGITIPIMVVGLVIAFLLSKRGAD